jgi:hypothetical protein
VFRSIDLLAAGHERVPAASRERPLQSPNGELMTSIVARGRWTVLYAWLAAGAAPVMVGCATGGGPGGPGGGVGSTLNMQFSGAPELAGTASLPADAGGPPVAVVAATVLEVLQWPVLSVDTAQGGLVSDWLYFEPAIRGSSRQTYCQNPMALRFTVRKTPKGWTELTAEAYVPRSAGSGRSMRGGWDDSLVPRDEPDRRNALGQARGALASFRKAIVAATVDLATASRAITDFDQQLDNGGFRRCAAPGG